METGGAGNRYLYQQQYVQFENESLFFPFQPKKPVFRFHDKCSYFPSKKIPLLIIAMVKDDLL